MGNDDDTCTRLAAMEREHARLDTEWNAIGSDLARFADDPALALALPLLLPRELRDAIEAVPTSPAAAPHAAHLIRA